MVDLAGTALFACLLQSGAPAKDPVSEAIALATVFEATIDEKRYDDAGKQVAPLVAKYAELGRILAPKEAAREPTMREVLAVARSVRKLIGDSIEDALKDPRLPATLQTELLRQLDARTDDGDKILLHAMKLKHVADTPASMAAAIRALGTYRRTQHLDTFEKLLSDPRADVLNATASALGGYFGEKESTRKRIVASLILAYSGAGSGFSPGSTARSMVDGDLVMAIRHEFQYALARLTGGVHFNRAKEWTEWWRDAKSAPWKDGVDKPDVKLDGLQGGSKPGGH